MNTVETILMEIARDCEDVVSEKTSSAVATLVVVAPGHLASKRWVFPAPEDMGRFLTVLKNAGYFERFDIPGIVQ